MSQKLETYIIQFSTKTDALHKNGNIAPKHSDQNHLVEIENLAPKDHIQQLQVQLKGITKKMTISQQQLKHN